MTQKNKESKPTDRHQVRLCKSCSTYKGWWEFSGNQTTCVECMLELYGQGLHALKTTARLTD